MPITQNSPAFRFTNTIPDDAAHPAVVKGIRDTFKALTDIYSAIPALKAQIDAHTTAMAAASTASGGSVTVITNNPFPGLGAANDQTGNTTYTVISTDNGILLILNDASPVAVSLDSSLATPYFIFVANSGAGTVTFTPTFGLINGAASYALTTGEFVMIVFDGANWKTSAVLTFVLPNTIAPVAGEYLTGYDATTGDFSLSTPAGIDATITTAALTTGGTQGSMTFSNGLLVSQVQAT